MIKNTHRAYRIWRRWGWRTLLDKLGRRLSGGSYWGGYSRDALAFASWMDFSSADLHASQGVHRSNPGQLDVKTIAWFLPEFENPFYGGIHTLLRFADYFKREKGVNNCFIILGEIDEALVRERIASAFPALSGEPIQNVTLFEQVPGLPPSDVAVASLWGTAYFVLRFNQARRKFYFIQDYEPLFYPAGSTFAQVEATYRFGFYGLTNTPTIKKIYEEEYGGAAESFLPCVDTGIFYPDGSNSRADGPLKVFFYGRPRHPRNGFELGAQALRLVKKKMGDRVRFLAAGDRWDPEDYGLKGVVESLGLLGYRETAELYRTCHAGLVMMFTRHPSYLPFELMASGALVITNANPATAWLLQDRVNCRLSSASATRLAEVITEALEDDAERQRLTQNALGQIRGSHSDWPAEMDKIHAYLGAPRPGAGAS